MHIKKPGLVLLCCTFAIFLLSCANPQHISSTPETPVASSNITSTYTKLTQTGGTLFRLNPAASTVRIYAFRGGLAGKLGHNHVLSAPQFTGFFYAPASGLAQSQFDLEFRLDQLQLDNPEQRAALGPAFASVLDEDAIASTRSHMLGDSNLQADKYPLLRIHSLQITGEAPKFAAKIQIELHGQLREMWVPLSVQGLPEKLLVTGALVVKQTDFGITPYSALGGLLAVQDELLIEFQLCSANR
ncbi:YceI family protein [Solimicrobium silvestre]|uniref:YceI-like domain n=1 Tax=Solimicrobium silvestre TaxID=2099400 RepID=A0A2S9H4K8_9BURK|nr:YceI family protein [Solimicrobium silvestre]PRC94920.1 YceI-like domain [Solimicrobium silvestre]